MKKIAICYLTHNHPDIVQEVLNNSIDIYKEMKIDLYICDDSTDEKTKNVVYKFIEDGYNNIFYKDAHGVETGDGKYLAIIQKRFLDDDYDYLWPVKDRVYFSRNLLDNIRRAAEEEYDVIMPANELIRWELKWPSLKDEYSSAVEYFAHYGQFVTNWQCILYNTKTILDINDWMYYIDKYKISTENHFIQPTMVFVRLSELETTKIKVFHVSNADIIEEQGESGWYKQVVEIWLKDWVNAILSLPDIYNPYKLAVIKAQTNFGVLFGSVTQLMGYRNVGIITKDIFEKYKPMWNMVSDIPIVIPQLLVEGKDQELVNFIVNSLELILNQGNYEKAYYVLTSNDWIIKEIANDYERLRKDLFTYRIQVITEGKSTIFNDIHSINDILKKYEKL